MINLSEKCSEKLCNSLLSTLSRNVDHIDVMVATLKSMKQVREYTRMRQAGKILESGFEKRDLVSSNGLK